MFESLVVYGVIIILVLFFSVRSTIIPKVTSSKNIKGLKTIPENLSYRYYLDNTGIAFDIENKNIYLIDHQKRKTYHVSMIRGCSYSYGGETQYYGNDLNTTMINLRNKKDAYERSGLFINVADIAQPQWQIKFSNEKLLLRYFEILKQFTEGTLPPQKNTPSM